ncbi:hypothetical protein EVAR_14053_1 [Eumeta japonica]|uniref:Uncharacterized protein n=1 Tax=Eumeta variegata TaxID=151549 RepID=A0A4C1UN71_EUMVA|nr:hypothetical protein EVAR_14053_1 [Eumeta japonica]
MSTPGNGDRPEGRRARAACRMKRKIKRPKRVALHNWRQTSGQRVRTEFLAINVTHLAQAAALPALDRTFEIITPTLFVHLTGPTELEPTDNDSMLKPLSYRLKTVDL